MSTKGGYVEILEFTHFSRVFRFNHTGESFSSYGTGMSGHKNLQFTIKVISEIIFINN